MVSSLVTNASRIDHDWCKLFLPELGWLVLSLDSANPQTCVEIGRNPKNGYVNHPDRILHVATMVQDRNGTHPEHQVRLKVNIVVTSKNAHEDPSGFLRCLRPERVKLLQCAVRPGENDDAAYLQCSNAAFKAYCQRVSMLQAEGIAVVTEYEEDQRGSYAMIDPKGCFFQSDVVGRLKTSQPILRVGLDVAWKEVGGYDAEKFRARGGDYDAGTPASG
jgi:radical S-adenosyl methionine domain-containing protein 2